MEVKNIILFVIIIVLLIIVIRYVMKDVNTLSGLTSAQTMQTLQPDDLASSSRTALHYFLSYLLSDKSFLFPTRAIIESSLFKSFISFIQKLVCPKDSLSNSNH
jgi:hypothetical protein